MLLDTALFGPKHLALYAVVIVLLIVAGVMFARRR
jgi:hypothetical protein